MGLGLLGVHWVRTSFKWLASRSAHRRSVWTFFSVSQASVIDISVGVVTQVSKNLLISPVSGLLGLAFESIASSGATPFWQALANQAGTLDEPLMAFQLTRFVDVANAQATEPGGTFSLGAVNTSLFTGDIDYQDIPGGKGTYWIQELTGTPRGIYQLSRVLTVVTQV